MVEINKGL